MASRVFTWFDVAFNGIGLLHEIDDSPLGVLVE